MTKPRLWLFITLLLAVSTGLLTYKYLSDVRKPAGAGPTVGQVTAKVKIPSGTRITADMLETREVPKEYAHPSGVRDVSAVVGQYAVVDILPGDVIVSDRVAQDRSVNELPYKIPSGKRAITVPVTALTGVAGLIKPGHHVDVLVSYKISDTPLDYKVMTLVQDVLVLAVGSEMQKKDGVQQADNVTLAVSPNEAELVALGESIGKIKLVERPSSGEPPAALPYVDVARMLKMFP